MFANTKAYNKPDSDIVYMAKVLEEVFDRGIASLKAQGISDLEEGVLLFVCMRVTRAYAQTRRPITLFKANATAFIAIESRY